MTVVEVDLRISLGAAADNGVMGDQQGARDCKKYI